MIDKLNKAMIKYSLIIRVVFSVIVSLVMYGITRSVTYSLSVLMALIALVLFKALLEYEQLKKKEQ